MSVMDGSRSVDAVDDKEVSVENERVYNSNRTHRKYGSLSKDLIVRTNLGWSENFPPIF